MIPFHDIVEACKAEAIAGRFHPTDSANWRWFCREYSKVFHTPLHEVLEMPAEYVILHVFENQLEMKDMDKDEDVESLITQIRRIEDPNYDSAQEKQVTDFVAFAEKMEKERLAKGAAIPYPTRKKTEQKQKPADFTPDQKPKELPKSGGINFAYLENDKNER